MIALTDKDTVKRILKQKVTEDFNDDTLDMLINAVSKHVETTILERHSQRIERIEYFTLPQDLVTFNVGGYQEVAILLKGWPVTTITGIWNDSNRDFGAGTELSLTDDIVFLSTEEGRGRLYFKSGLSLQSGLLSLKIQYTGGLAVDPAEVVTVYPDIAYAVGQQVAHAFRRADKSDLKAERLNGIQTSFNPLEMLPYLEDILRPYMRNYPDGVASL